MHASVVFLLVGGALALVGGLWLLVASFRTSLLWGLACLLCSPLGPLLFVVLHWRAASTPFLVNLVGSLLAMGGLATLPPELRQPRPGSPAAPLLAQAQRATEAFARVGGNAVEQARGAPPPRTLYRWTDKEGSVNYTDDFNTIPERYRHRAQTTLGGNVVIVQSTPQERSKPRSSGSRREGSVRLLLFSAGWCPACRRLEASGVLERFASKHPDVPVERVDVDSQGQRAAQYGIRAIPTVVLVDSAGTELARPSHAGSEEALEQALSKAQGG